MLAQDGSSMRGRDTADHGPFEVMVEVRGHWRSLKAVGTWTGQAFGE